MTDSLTGKALEFDFETIPEYTAQDRFCGVFGIQSESEYELFVTYLLLTVDSYNPLRIQRMTRFRDLLFEIDDPVLNIIGHLWLRVLGNRHGGYQELNDWYARPKRFPFVVHEGLVESVLIGSDVWGQGLRPGCSFQELLKEDRGVQTWLVRNSTDSSKFQVDLIEGSYYIQHDGGGMEMLGDAALVAEFEANSDELCEAELEEMKWVMGASESSPNYLRLLPGQGVYIAAFNTSEMAATSAEGVAGIQNPTWEEKLALLENSLDIARGFHDLGANATGLSVVFHRRLGMDINGINVRLTNMSDSLKTEVNWRKVRKVLLSASEVYSDALNDWSGYSGLLEPQLPQYQAYSLGGKLFDLAALIYSLRDECSFTAADIDSIEQLLSRMDEEWYLTGGEVDVYFLNYSGAKCWDAVNSDANKAAGYAVEALSTWVDSIYHGSDYDVIEIYEGSPFIGFLSLADWEAVDDNLKLGVVEGLIKMNANFSCGYVRPVYWGLDIAETINVAALDLAQRRKLERVLLLLVDTSFLCHDVSAENKVKILTQLETIRNSYDGQGWFEYENGVEGYFDYRWE